MTGLQHCGFTSRRLAFVLLCGLFVLFTSPAHAGVYLTGGGGLGSFAYEDVDNGFGTKFTAGLLFTDEIGMEISLVDSGNADVDDFDATLSVGGLAIFGVYQYREPGSAAAIAYRAGLYNFDSTLEGDDVQGGKVTGDSTHIAFGMGLILGRETGWRFIGDIDFFANVEDFADDGSLMLITLGLGYQF